MIAIRRALYLCSRDQKIYRQCLIFFIDAQNHVSDIAMQNTDIFINPRQSVTFSNSIFHLEEKVTNYLFILHSQINKIASRADD